MAGAVISVLEELIHLGLGSGHGAAPHDPGCTGGRTERRVRRHTLQKEGTRGRGRLGWGIAHRCPCRACGSRILTSDGQTPRLAAPPPTAWDPVEKNADVLLSAKHTFPEDRKSVV